MKGNGQSRMEMRRELASKYKRWQRNLLEKWIKNFFVEIYIIYIRIRDPIHVCLFPSFTLSLLFKGERGIPIVLFERNAKLLQQIQTDDFPRKIIQEICLSNFSFQFALVLLPIIVRNSSTLQLLVFTGKNIKLILLAKNVIIRSLFLFLSLFYFRNRISPSTPSRARKYNFANRIFFPFFFFLFFISPLLQVSLHSMEKNFFSSRHVYIIPLSGLRMDFARIVWNRRVKNNRTGLKRSRIRAYGFN